MSERLRAAFAAVDRENARDPRREIGDEGEPVAVDLLYGQRMSAWLERLVPAAGETLRLAVRAQHIGRHAVPRGEYPDGKVGYKRWRSDLGRRHAEAAAAIAAEAGFAEAEVARVRDLVQKKGIKVDDEAQTLEDVACLVFLAHYFVDLADKHPHDKMVDIVQKTWRKMSPRGHAAALGIPLAPREAAIVGAALAAPTADPTASAPREEPS